MRKRWISLLILGFLTIWSWGTPQDKPVKSRLDMVLERAAKRTTLQMRKDAAAKRAAAALNGAVKADPLSGSAKFGDNPDYFGGIPNWANSPNLRKFMDSLPGLNQANNLGQMIPVAVPDTITFPGSDLYVIAVQEFTEKMHSQLKPTRLRGYVQLNKGTANGQNIVNPAPIHYLGPLIVAQRDRPVRIILRNMLPVGSDGDLFIPTDTTAMGAGMGVYGTEYTQNRATLHLHGGRTPWISDGTPHQWTAPAGEQTAYKKGISTQYVPDMWFNASGQIVPAGTPGAANNPGEGAMTFFYTNQQSARLMFYHDHSYGITRLNVYVGEAAGYLITDPVDSILMNGGVLGGKTVAAGTVPSTQVPLIIQDKTFVDPDKTQKRDPTWRWGGEGQLWFPHVYMPNQNPNDPSGANDMGRWDYGPWFWPPVQNLANKPITLSDGTVIPGTPNPSLVPEAFMDTPLVNGTAYPYLTVERKAYRFRILNATASSTCSFITRTRAWTSDSVPDPPAIPDKAPRSRWCRPCRPPASPPTGRRTGGWAACPTRPWSVPT
jgi:FtsP/CotA-like multicopper oxidase with cupredoxin domain